MINCTLLPNFIILGAQKSGTTSLHQSLDIHSQVFVSDTKEISFFNIDKNYNRGIQWYSSFFVKRKNEKAIGESTPSYLWDARVPERIKKVLPNGKFIILLRNPVNRAYSAYWYAYIGGDETLSFEEALDAEPGRAMMGSEIRGFSSYVDRGLYATQIMRYYKHFSPDQFLIIILEEYQQEPQNTLVEVTKFLDISCNQAFLNKGIDMRKNLSRVPRSKSVHRIVPFFSRNFPLGAKVIRRLNLKNDKYPPMNSTTLMDLRNRFAVPNQELEELLKRKIDIWR